MKQVLAIQPNDLTRYWPEVRQGVALIESPEKLIEEDVYFQCKAGQAQLFFLMVDGKRVGHMILKLVGTDLHIWQVQGDNGYDVLRTFRDEVMTIARGANAHMLTYASAREGWRKESKNHGFKMRMVVYECPIDPPVKISEETPLEDGTSKDVGN